ncbi:hypothetical protein GYMLUDRAFT_170833 [Collybiopsis luxurians FD-317 M1]|uniref:Protein kinase domain-containing protein n=1 Tax=Collybiopsis luxurians FD-317 M1 TaxID=944289 RepID=A0A0D0CSD8_9AGAR|nr:hypothetical protein GYMLUDRAFT_170833 [Collybiopsis luxurians FD-317 M1]
MGSAVLSGLEPSLIVQNVKRDGPGPVAIGGFADIWCGMIEDQKVCLKVLRLVEEPDEELQRFYREALVWQQLEHPNILPFLGVNEELFHPSFCLISPWMKNRNVISFLDRDPAYNRYTLLTDIAAGIAYLHSRKPAIVHGDIRGANVLVTDDFRCCLTDFGLTLVRDDFLSQRWTTSSTPMKGAIRWMAPELLDPDDSGVLSHTSRDIYAFGMTVIEILTLQLPFYDQRTDYAVLACVVTGKRPPRPQTSLCTEALWDLTVRCWAQDPLDRPEAREVHESLQSMQ